MVPRFFLLHLLPLAVETSLFKCPEGMLVGANGKCYEIQTYANWTDSNRQCGETNTRISLASIHNEELNDFFKNVLSGIHKLDVYKKFWIGGFLLGGSWQWTDGSTFNYTEWTPGHKVPYSGNYFIQISPDGYWHAVSGDEWAYGICSESQWGRSFPNCPVGTYAGYNYDCYDVGFDAKTWDDAREVCLSRGGDLASIHSSQENMLISSSIPGVDATFWSGLMFVADVGWRWSDGTPFNFTTPLSSSRYLEFSAVGYVDTSNELWSVDKKDTPDQKRPYICKFTVTSVSSSSHSQFVSTSTARVTQTSTSNRVSSKKTTTNKHSSASSAPTATMSATLATSLTHLQHCEPAPRADSKRCICGKVQCQPREVCFSAASMCVHDCPDLPKVATSDCACGQERCSVGMTCDATLSHCSTPAVMCSQSPQSAPSDCVCGSATCKANQTCVAAKSECLYFCPVDGSASAHCACGTTFCEKGDICWSDASICASDCPLLPTPAQSPCNCNKALCKRGQVCERKGAQCYEAAMSPYSSTTTQSGYPTGSNFNLLPVYIGVPLFVFIIAMLASVFWYKRCRNSAPIPSVATNDTWSASYESIRDERTWDFPTDNRSKSVIDQNDLSISTHVIITGAFTSLFKATLRQRLPGSEAYSLSTVVAKVLRPDKTAKHKSDVLREICLLQSLGRHPHIIRAIGYALVAECPVLVLEYCESGDLLCFVRTHLQNSKRAVQSAREDLCLTPYSNVRVALSDLMSILWQISDGMTYFTLKGYIHRDLAARNIMLTSARVAKIADFGMCRYSDQEMYACTGELTLPLRWSAPEAVCHGQFSEKSDVWSFGVLSWEVFSAGSVPYVDLTSSELVHFINDGQRLEQPLLCPLDSYRMMLDCWNTDRTKRPTFAEVGKYFADCLEYLTKDYDYLQIVKYSDSIA